MEGGDHRAKLGRLLPEVARGGKPSVGREKPQRVVAPIVVETACCQPWFGNAVVHRQKLDCGDAQVEQVLDNTGMRQPGVSTAQMFGYARVGHGEAAHVKLIDHGVAPWHARRVHHRRPVIRSDHRPWQVGRGVADVGLAAERVIVMGIERIVVAHLAGDGFGVRVNEEFVGVETLPLGGIPRAVYPVAVALPRLDVG